MDLSLVTKQIQTLSPQMMQSMEILQMSSQELLEYIQDAVQENPVLEVSETEDTQDEFSTLRRKLEWLESTDIQNRFYHLDDEDDSSDPISNYGTVDEWEENLYYYLFAQLQGQDLPSDVVTASKYIIESLNQMGYLDEDVDVLSRHLDCSIPVVEEALRVVQNMDPAGVGARSLSECLCIQLKRMGEENSLAMKIVKSHLVSLAKNRYGFIARQLGVDCAEVREASERIRTLNPKPGTGFSARERLTYVVPDIIVVNFQDHFELLTNDYYFPSLSISGYYKVLMKNSADEGVKNYLMDKMRQAKWMVRNIEQRRSTLMDCARCIVDLQESFFRHGPGHLVPMTLADVAGSLSVHESTVSRAMREKYIQCSNGVYPFHYFFSRGLSSAGPAVSRDGRVSETVSPDSAKALLKKLISEEDKSKPLSDQKICTLMEREGIQISRRTVAKYRDELNIPCTTGRKEYA